MRTPPATTGAKRLAAQLGLAIGDVKPSSVLVTTADVHRHHAQLTGEEATASATVRPAPIKKKSKKRQQRGTAGPQLQSASAESRLQEEKLISKPDLEAEEEDGNLDPLLLDGNRLRVHWPLQGGACSEVAGAVRWLPERAALGRTRTYRIEFDDGDAMLTALVDKVAFTVTQGNRTAPLKWTAREERAVVKRRRAARVGTEVWASIGRSVGRSGGAVAARFALLTDPSFTPASGATSPGRPCHFTLALTVIGCHSLGIYIVTLLPSLSFSVKMTVLPRARYDGCEDGAERRVAEYRTKGAAGLPGADRHGSSRGRACH